VEADVTTYREQLAAAIDKARGPLVDRVVETVIENSFTGVTGEAEMGKSLIVDRAGRLLRAEGFKFIRLDLDEIYSPNHLAWTWARQMARTVMDPVAFSHMTSLGAGMWPGSTRADFVALPDRIGPEAARLAQHPHPEGTVGSTQQLAALARATADMVRRELRVVLVIDHLEAQATARGKTPGARELLWLIRSSSQHTRDLRVVVACRPAAQNVAADERAAFHGDGRWLTIGPLTADDLPDDVNMQAPTLIAATRGHPAAVQELIVEMFTGESSPGGNVGGGVAMQTAIGRLVGRHSSLAGRYLQHARSLHRLGGHLLKVIAAGEGPYTGSPNIDPSQIADAMKRLDLAGLVAKPDRQSTDWVIADPRVAWVLTGQPAWIIPARVDVSAGASLELTAPDDLLVSPDLHRALANWPTEFSDREHRLLSELATGATNEDISDRLGISRATVTRQLADLYRKLSVADRQEAVQRLRALANMTE
jgi:DNA-binding CsgD family transcriptional regulator